MAFWAKASPSYQSSRGSHPIVYHSLDVAAVGAELIVRGRGCLERLCSSAGIDVGVLIGTLPFLLSVHDIGKYSRVFQAKSPEHWPADCLGSFREIAPGNSHVVTGFQILQSLSDDDGPRDRLTAKVT
jgi:CRISPR-associated endonuclease/helicase Cas3